ncbi:MAG TPA: hypothetical protein VFI91_01775 [Longimicrobiaceae bacterium]|nr:hypothetical protein [Longimicrobiaceae bacterium]
MRRAILTMMVPLILGACGGSTGPDDRHSLNGQWESQDFRADEVLMTLTVTNRQVVGHGSLTNTTSSTALTIEGTYVPPSVSLNLGLERFEDINFEGTFEDDNTLIGTLRGSGFDAEPITFVRVEEEN